MSSLGRASQGSAFALLVATGLSGLGWAWLLGDFAVGAPALALALVAAGVPIFILWAALNVLRLHGSAGVIHLSFVALATIATMIVAYQPWNPRAQFVRTLYSIQPGMTQQDVEGKMVGFIGGEVVENVREWDERRKGTTHTMKYRWDHGGGYNNADLGTVYLRDGRVVARDFTPD